MSIITDVSRTWSSSVTLGSNEFWQVKKGPVYVATGAASAPSLDEDGLLLSAGDILALTNADVVRYRSARPEGDGEIVRRARA